MVRPSSYTMTTKDQNGITMNLTIASTPVHEAGVSADEFKHAFRNHPAGVAVITADAGNGPVAMTATSVSSLSAEPPMLVFSVSGQSSSAPTIRASDTVVVHLLGAEQLDLAKLGATSGIDRFADTTLWKRLPTGEPVFPAAQSWLRGRIATQVEVGGSTVILLHVLETKESTAPGGPESAEPLVYHNRTWHRLGESSTI